MDLSFSDTRPLHGVACPCSNCEHFRQRARMERHAPDKALRRNAHFVCELPKDAEFVVFRGLLVVIVPHAEPFFIRPSDGARGVISWEAP